MIDIARALASGTTLMTHRRLDAASFRYKISHGSDSGAYSVLVLICAHLVSHGLLSWVHHGFILGPPWSPFGGHLGASWGHLGASWGLQNGSPPQALALSGLLLKTRVFASTKRSLCSKCAFRRSETSFFWLLVVVVVIIIMVIVVYYYLLRLVILGVLASGNKQHTSSTSIGNNCILLPNLLFFISNTKHLRFSLFLLF